MQKIQLTIQLTKEAKIWRAMIFISLALAIILSVFAGVYWNSVIAAGVVYIIFAILMCYSVYRYCRIFIRAAFQC